MMGEQTKLFSNTLPVKTTQSFYPFWQETCVNTKRNVNHWALHRHLGEAAAASSNGEHELLQDTFEKFSVHQIPLRVQLHLHSVCCQQQQGATQRNAEPFKDLPVI